MLDAASRPAGWIGVSVDLTKRLESERALRAASNYLQAVADSLGDGLFTLDTEGRVSYVNEAAEQLLGWSSEELLGRVMHEIAHSDRAQPGLEVWPILNAGSDGPRATRRRRLHPPQTAPSCPSPTPPRRSRPTTGFRAASSSSRTSPSARRTRRALHARGREAVVDRPHPGRARGRSLRALRAADHRCAQRRGRPARAAAAPARKRRGDRRTGRVPAGRRASTG